MIHRLYVQGYKSLVDTEVHLAPLTVVFGANAAGKSNLFDLMGLLSRMADAPDLEEAFASHRGTPLEAFTLGAGLEELQRRRTATFSVQVDLEVSPSVVRAVEEQYEEEWTQYQFASLHRSHPIKYRRLRYTLGISISTRSGALRVTGERLEPLTAAWVVSRERTPFVETVDDRIIVRLEHPGQPRREVVGQRRTVISQLALAVYHPHMMAARLEMANWRIFFLDPGAMRTESPVKEVRSLPSNGSDLPAFYNTLKELNERQFIAMEKAMRSVIPTIDGLDLERTRTGFLRLWIREGGVEIPPRLVSEGTLRVLGFLAMTNPIDPMTVVGCEEPENGIDPRRLSMIARLFLTAVERGSSQFVVNTHSPIFPEFFLGREDTRLVHCRRAGSSTVFDPFSPSGLLSDEAELASAFDAPVSRFRDRLVRGDFVG